MSPEPGVPSSHNKLPPSDDHLLQIRSLLRAIRAQDHGISRKVWLSWAAAVVGIGAVMLMAGLEFVLAGSHSSPSERFGNDVIVSASSDLSPISAEPQSNAGPAAAKAHRRKRVKTLVGLVAAAGPSGQAYCVRLCDGFFFPLGTVKTNVSLVPEAGMCSQLCPGAPTKVFVRPSDSDDIEKAMSSDGKTYSALPVALRHTLATDETCACHAPNQANLASLMSDFTLRAGDAVITASGVRVFRGARHWPYQNNDFIALAQSRSLPTGRPILIAIDKLMRSPKAARVETNQRFAATPAPAADDKVARSDIVVQSFPTLTGTR